MSVITEGNWSFRDPGDDVPSGSVITGGNFSQLAPDTPILAGKTLTIRGGNWINVRQDPAWTIEGGNWAQVNRCAHLHPEWGLAAEPDNCAHVTAVEEIVVDSVVVETIYMREDTVI